MAYPIFVPPISPTYGSPRQHKTRVLEAAFGDGYSQRVVDGLNYQTETLSLTFDSLTVDQKDEIVTFLNARSGVDAFDYMLPGDSAFTRYYAPDWTITQIAPNAFQLQVEFKRVFDL